MNPVSLLRLAFAGLTSLASLAALPTLAQDAPRVPGNRYVVVNQTGAPLACRYRVNSTASGGGTSSWQTLSPVAVGAEFNHVARAPGESVSLECPVGSGSPVTVQPGRHYSATKAGDGKVVVARD